MKTIVNLVVATSLSLGCITSVNAQRQTPKHHNLKNKYTVSARLSEESGSYSDRKLCRIFLTDAMKKCPYISEFHIKEVEGAKDNHQVVWMYNVKGWDDITHFYSWINTAIHSAKDSILIEALTPYAPEYVLGGVISVNNISKMQMAKN